MNQPIGTLHLAFLLRRLERPPVDSCLRDQCPHARMRIMAFHTLEYCRCRSETADQRCGCEIQEKRQKIRGSVLQKQGLELEEWRVSVAA